MHDKRVTGVFEDGPQFFPPFGDADFTAVLADQAGTDRLERRHVPVKCVADSPKAAVSVLSVETDQHSLNLPGPQKDADVLVGLCEVIQIVVGGGGKSIRNVLLTR